MLTGGSVYGLATCDGVVRWLAERRWGFPLAEGRGGPDWPAAALFDLGRGKHFVPPVNANWGRTACQSAQDSLFALGSVGAGTGALSGGIKGGLGTASEILDFGVTVAALVAVNSLGSVIDSMNGRPWEIRLEMSEEFGEIGKRSVRLPDTPLPHLLPIRPSGSSPPMQSSPRPKHRKWPRWPRMDWPELYDRRTPCSMETPSSASPPTKWFCPILPGFFASPKAQAMNELGLGRGRLPD